MKKIIIIIAVVLIVGGGGYALLSRDSDDQTTQSENSSQSTANSPKQASSDNGNSGDAQTVTITYSNSGYSPATITVKSGDKVVIKNDSSRDMQFDSDPHPAHTDNEELNVGIVSPGESMSFVVKRTGTFGYHNHLNASDTGTIIVQ